ncbi:MAG TPA: protocatechuate 3,4-dioxygenase subunit alpha [Pilimelia sp.]|nr:protocatechuate 3,4-dioxygenase subunit alpha [Pilimelia sp.]
MPTPPTTPSQTVGPFFGVPGALPWADGPYAVPAGTPGAVRIGGRVLDGEGQPVPDALIETWQADPDGRLDHPDDPRPRGRGSEAALFRGFGRCATDADGRYWILTTKPGALPTPDGRVEAPHIDVSVFARGLLHRLVTRIYFPDETAANAPDPVLSGIPDPDARATLIARPEADALRFDIHLQGPDETVFFAV